MASGAPGQAAMERRQGASSDFRFPSVIPVVHLSFAELLEET